MFDDFNYTSVDDAALSSFNEWNIINGVSGPPEGGLYQRSNIRFKPDPVDPSNYLMTLSTTVNGQTDAITHARIETQGYEYFEGTYAARVYFSETPFYYKDANIQTFYTIVGSNLSGDGSKYSELDFEYMAADKWGISEDNQVMYLTSWNRYIASPWQAWKRYWSEQKSYEGWHTFVVTCTDGVNVNYWMDGVFITSMATTDNDGTSVYPRSPMQVAFANWVWNSVIGTSADTRETTMEVDWVLFQKDTELNPVEVQNVVNDFRSQGVKRRNLNGQTYVVAPVEQSPYNNVAATIPGVVEAENYNEGGQGLAYNESDNINEGGVYRTDGVDIEENGKGGYNVGYTISGEWLEYTVNVLETTQYTLTASLANGGDVSGVFHLEIDGVAVGNSIEVTNTGGWLNWIEMILDPISLSAGEHILRLVVDQGGFNVDHLVFEIDQITASEFYDVDDEQWIYPNPANDVINIQIGSDFEGVDIRIVNVQGETVLQGRITNYQVSIKSLLPGLYWVELVGQERSFRQFFMKQ